MSMLGPSEPTGHRDGVFGLLERDGCVLLVSNPRAIEGTRRLVWDLPGGTVVPGESLVDALVREMSEETGLEIEPEPDLLLVIDGVKQRDAGPGPSAQVVYTWRSFVFAVRARGEPRAGQGIAECALVPRTRVGDHLTAPYHGPLRAYLAGRAAPYARVRWTDPLPAATSGPGPQADRLRRLLVIAAAAAGGLTDLVRREVDAALLDGESPARIAEALLQVVPYAGFPRTLSAFTAVRDVLTVSAAASEGDTTPGAMREAGRRAFGEVYAEHAVRLAKGLEQVQPILARWIEEFAYGRVLARGGLTMLERELLAVALLTSLGGLTDPLLGHMRAARRLGATTNDLAAAIDAVPAALGGARGDASRALIPLA